MRRICIARQLAMYLMRNFCHPYQTVTAIGNRFNMDHTTVVFACKTVQALIDTDDEFYHIVKGIVGPTKKLRRNNIKKNAA